MGLDNEEENIRDHDTQRDRDTQRKQANKDYVEKRFHARARDVRETCLGSVGAEETKQFIVMV